MGEQAVDLAAAGFQRGSGGVGHSKSPEVPFDAAMLSWCPQKSPMARVHSM
jgi:hypothetical protein